MLSWAKFWGSLLVLPDIICIYYFFPSTNKFFRKSFISCTLTVTTNNKFRLWPNSQTDGPFVKFFIKKLFCCFSFEYNETWFSCSYLYVPTNTSPIFIEFNWKTKKFFNDTVRPLRTGEFGMKTGDLNLLLVVYIIEPCICNIIMHGMYILIHYSI